MCGYIERYVPERRWMLAQTALFKFTDGDYARLGPSTAEEREDIRTEFFLPFSSVILTDEKTCVWLGDVGKEHGFGPGVERRFAHFVEYTFGNGDVGSNVMYGSVLFNGAPFNGAGAVDVRAERLSSHSNWMGYVGERDIGYYESVVPDDARKATDDARVGVVRALRLLHALNTRDRFVVECSPSTPHKGPKIPREHQRSTYTLLTVPEIRTTLGLAAEGKQEGTARAPHARRRHWRTYEDERFVNMKGQRILIPATWVGPEETVVGGRKYRVRVDL